MAREDVAAARWTTGFYSRRLFDRVKREINVPRELYRTWIWRGPAAVVNRAGSASLVLTSPAPVNARTEVRLTVPLRINKGSERPGRLDYTNATAKLYRHRLPLVLLPEKSFLFKLNHIPPMETLESKGWLSVELEFAAAYGVREPSLLPAHRFGALITGIELELDGAGRRELPPVLSWGSVT